MGLQHWIKIYHSCLKNKKITFNTAVYFQILDKTQDDVYKGVHSTAISKTIAYYRLCMDEQAINDTGIAPALQVCWMNRPSMTPVLHRHYRYVG